ncbi:MAG TPA: hypothetical protein VI233_17325 [Puia sp.]
MNRILFYYGLPCLLLACHTRTAPATRVETHLAQVSRSGTALFVDRVDNRMVMQTDSTNSFCSFQIGWTDSAVSFQQAQAAEKERYFQYRIQQDWKALAHGDTLYPVFFQEKPGLGQERKEGVLVFALKDGTQPDTLIYRDSYGNWGTQYFIVNRN